MGRLKQLIPLGLSLSLAIWAILWLVDNLSLAELSSSFVRIPIQGAVISLILNLSILCIYGIRLGQLLGGRWTAGSAIAVVGFGMNNGLPFRLGELVKLAYARQRFDMPTTRVVAALAAEKALDLLALLGTGVIASHFIATPYLQAKLAVLGYAVLALAVAIALAIVAERILRKSEARLPGGLNAAFESLRDQRAAHRVFRLGVLTSLIWVITYAAVYAMFAAIFPEFSIMDSVLITLILALAVALPGTPAGLGVVEAGIVTYLSKILDADIALSLAAAIVFHSAIIVPQLGIAIVLLAESALHSHRRTQATDNA